MSPCYFGFARHWSRGNPTGKVVWVDYQRKCLMWGIDLDICKTKNPCEWDYRSWKLFASIEFLSSSNTSPSFPIFFGSLFSFVCRRQAPSVGEWCGPKCLAKHVVRCQELWQVVLFGLSIASRKGSITSTMRKPDWIWLFWVWTWIQSKRLWAEAS